MGAGSPPGDDNVEDAQNGIVQGHAYGIIRLEEVSFGGHTYRMIMVRNPWGDNPPPSKTPLDWFPTSPMWNRKGGEYMKFKLGYNPDNGMDVSPLCRVVRERGCVGSLTLVPLCGWRSEQRQRRVLDEVRGLSPAVCNSVCVSVRPHQASGTRG